MNIYFPVDVEARLGYPHKCLSLGSCNKPIFNPQSNAMEKSITYLPFRRLFGGNKRFSVSVSTCTTPNCLNSESLLCLCSVLKLLVESRLSFPIIVPIILDFDTSHVYVMSRNLHLRIISAFHRYVDLRRERYNIYESFFR